MSAKYVRKNKLVKPGLQLRLTIVFLCIACASVAILAIVLNSSMHTLLAKVEQGEASLLGEWPAVLGSNLLIAFALMVPATLGVGVWATFKVCGPLYKFESHLKRILQGEDPGDCTLRKSDELHDLCALLNQTIRYLRANNAAVDATPFADDSDQAKAA